MSARPARRTTATRKKVIQSDSDSSEVDDLQETPKRDSRRDTVGSRASFDDEYSPRKSRRSISRTPATAKRKSAARVPLSEATENLGFKTTKIKASNPIVKTGFEQAIKADHSQKENQIPSAINKLKIHTDMPPPPTLPISTLSPTRSFNTGDVMPDSGNVAVVTPLPMPEGPKSRIVIAKLVLQNFKSYAGVQRIGPFHKSFSAVVGPNGSGKSNVIDSLLFVFGFRASKMRQGKISALIHNSAAHPDLNSCSVEVHFESILESPDPDHYEVVENSSIVVARTAYKNNSSKYTINGRDSSFTEVTTLLKDKGIDLDHKRFLILQGEVESIAQMRPKAANEHDDGLLEYLEDIVGTSKYKSPIEGAIERMEALNVICQEKSSRVHLVEKERANLEERKNTALKHILMENELASKQSVLFQIFVSECKANIQITQQVIQELELELNTGLKSFEGNQDLISQLEKKQKSATKEQDRLKALIGKYSAEAAKIEKENVSFQEKIKHLATKQKKLSKSNAAAQHALTESSLQVDTSNTEISKFKNDLAALGASLLKEDQELTKVRLALKDKTQAFSDQIEIKQKQKQPWDAQIAEKRSALDVACAELDMLNEQSSQINEDLAAAIAQLEALQDQGQAKIQEIQMVETELSEATSQLEKTKKDVARLKVEEISAKSEHFKARDKADEARSSFSASKQKGDVLSGLNSLRDSGRIVGFHGRLGDLGTIAEKFDVAITTACPGLNNIVVDDVEVGQQCIEHLRRNNLGRANFLLLDKLPQQNSGKISTPENVPRLVDLVQAVNPRFQAAFYKVLGDTLVVANLTQANRIAYGKTRWRVVTLDGQLIELSGAMTGGGTQVRRGGMSSDLVSASTRDSVTKLENVEDKTRASLEKVQADINTLDANLDKLSIDIPALEVRKSRLNIEFGALDKQGKDTKKRVKELTQHKTHATVDTKRMQETEKSIRIYESAIAKLGKETAAIEADIQALQDKILEVGGIKLRTQQSKVDGLKDQIEALQQRLDGSEFSKTKAEQDVKKHSRTHTTGLAELAQLETELQSLQQEAENVLQKDFAIKELEEAKYALEECVSSMQETKSALDTEMATINAFRAKELELRNKLEDHRKRCQEDLKKLTHWSEKLSKLSLQELSKHFLDDATPSYSLEELSEDELSAMDKNELKTEICELEEAMANAKIESGILEEYLQRCEEYAERAKALEDAVTERDLARNTAEDLRKRRLTEFMTGFNIISLRLKEMYQMITMGGNAELELVDSLDPFSEGILFSVMPPKKSWKNISNLSGGEKTLSSLALVFALHHYKPTPLYVMDEIDAALDFRNVSIVANYIKDRTKNAQFIVISLRNNMFELSARLIGIYKTSNMTKSIAIENTEIGIPARPNQDTRVIGSTQ